jgi:hypothetical protein
MLSSPGGLTEAPSVAREHQPVLAGVSRTMHTLNQGEFADSHEVMLERLAHRRELGLGIRDRSSNATPSGGALCVRAR